MYTYAKLVILFQIHNKMALFFQKSGKKFGKLNYFYYLCCIKFITNYG